jgi:hypothetical protein
MVECFCGCGRSIPFTRRRANAMGPKVARELEDWELMRSAVEHEAERNTGVETFVEEGRRLHANLRASVHGEPVDTDFSHRRVVKWLRFSQRSRMGPGQQALRHALERRRGFEHVERDH